MNDVSVLFPLSTNAFEELLSADDSGLDGALLPRSVFDEIDVNLTNRLDDKDEIYDGLRVVGFRYDPCFIHMWGGATCQPQIRLVLQVIGRDGDKVVGFDGAIHLLYNLDRNENRSVVADLRAAAALAPESATVDELRVNPSLVAQSIDGHFGRALRALITSHAGSPNLARMTFMVRTNSRAGEWVFGAIGVKAFDSAGFEEVGKLEIPFVDATSQTVISNLSPGAEFTYSVIPSFSEEAGRIATSSDTIENLVHAETEKAAFEGWIGSVHNPSTQTADMIDCASCHLGNHIRRKALELDFDLSAEGDSIGGRATYGAEENSDNLRAFGYFEDAPVISQRTANETRNVLEFIEEFPSGEAQ